ncbi:hypothetical protein MCOR27_003579 [Pyricularia oryzae]|uniref:gamma-glutamylcyclotransferase n=1 Tax=Pyricularia grisea TaxID=148305 RepID=A0ABQ8NKT4_PYRGI|nr:hypothetical protein MCOR01_001703 [Pyricularia oryzae]KAI6298189.1 hypothetical protein MCOR33_005648 [Pyricularia grisea]KAI6263076.1 hypothetical protein MCOR19_000716 [Pyricularia oryzae]KAI6277347.1 hypothetical protein MCOR26_005162 [Pyricularia oryzae]KAI6282815.1 hypothetical protein MCOR27_003579 [Pyricularia oryzae]
MDGQAPVWYFAYGSNLSPSVMARRGITPLDARCVRVSSHMLVFDVFGVPYSEPAMAGIREKPAGCDTPAVHGVAYLISASDYQRLRVTEGAGTGYRDVELEADSVSLPPTSHTAYTTSDGGRLSVATLVAKNPFDPPRLPSRRYMDLIVGGAEQSGLPGEYVEYLRGLPAYQRPVLGWLHELLAIRAFLAFWIPILTFVMNRAKAARAPSSSSSPGWTAAVVNVLFRSMWLYHDAIHRRVFKCDGGAV